MGSKLIQILNRELRHLSELGYPKQMGAKKFAASRKKLMRIVKSVDDEPYIQSSIPVLVVVREQAVPLNWQVEKIEIDGRRGRTCLDTNLFRNRNGTQIPNSFIYPLLGVEVLGGAVTIPEQMHLNQEANRRGLTVPEGVALLTHADFFGPTISAFIRSRELYLLNALWGDNIPFLSSDCARPTLGCIMLSDSAKSDRWSFPSCSLDTLESAT